MDFSKYSNKNMPLLRANHPEKLYSRVWLYVLRIACLVILLGTFAVAGLGLGTFMGMLDDVPDINLGALNIGEYSTKFVYADGTPLTTLQTATKRTHLDIEKMPQDILDAVVAIEDERFYSHSGVDIEGILRAGFANLKSGGTGQGGSTLTQQVIKQLVLNSNQNWKRKFQEWYLSLKLEEQLTTEYGKEQAKLIILETYLNYNFLGYTCYGVEAASQRFFAKSATDLTLSECALLAGLFQAPSYYDPINNVEACEERLKEVLNAMKKNGFITEDEYIEALRDPIFERIEAHDTTYQENTESRIYSYFVDSAISEIRSDFINEMGMTSKEATEKLYYGGLTIYVTQDQKIQSIMDSYFSEESNYQPEAWYQLDYRLSIYDKKDNSIVTNPYCPVALYKTEEMAQAAVEEFRAKYVTPDMQEGKDYVQKITITKQPQYCMTIIDHNTGHIVGMVGGRGEKTANLALNRVNEPRQPGSTFKIIASYTAALESGLSPSSIVDDSPYVYKDWNPSNWYKGYYLGLTTLRLGVANSMNIVTARTMTDMVGIRPNFEMALNYGFTTLRDVDDVADASTSDVVGSLCLGSCSVSNLELTAAYATIANKGNYLQPIYYTKILDADGNIFYENSQNSHRVMKETTAWLLSDMMRDVVEGHEGHGTGTRVRFNYNMAIAGKTGTTSDTKDYTFVGYTPYYTAGIWAGYDYYTYRNTDLQQLGSSSYHQNLWKNIMKEIHAELPNISEFEKPDGIVSAKVCRDSGMLVSELCELDPRGSRVTTEFFDEENVPTETCTCHVQVTICSESGLYPSESCPEECHQTVVRIMRTPEQIAAIDETYAYWKEMIENPDEETGEVFYVADPMDYSWIRDWYLMAPECYNVIYVDPETHQQVKTDITEETLVVDVSETHTCPMYSLELPDDGGENSGGEDSGGEDSGGENSGSENSGAEDSGGEDSGDNEDNDEESGSSFWDQFFG